MIVVLQRLAEDLLIVSGMVYLDDAPKDEDDRPWEKVALEMVRRAVWGMLYADDAGVVSISPRELTGMIDVIVVAYQDFGLTAEKEDRDHVPVVPSQHTVEHAAT